MTDSTPNPAPSRRELMKPAQLLGLAFVAALFGGVITLISMGVFQAPRPVPAGQLDPQLKAWMVAGVVAGIVFIVTLVTIALLLLAVDPADLSKKVDRPVLMGSDDDAPAERGAPEQGSPDAGSAAPDRG
ncbi:MAG: hypothetical protein EOO67_20255 [Microbacterium sp.]|nr:MAG: hypothetical protein EOO67_20255 [Microbacterium sp.]